MAVITRIARPLPFFGAFPGDFEVFGRLFPVSFDLICFGLPRLFCSSVTSVPFLILSQQSCERFVVEIRPQHIIKNEF